MKAHEMLPDQQNSVVVDGVPVRKGSVGAFLVSWRTLQNESLPTAEREQAKADLLGLVPALQALGLFDVLTPRDPQLAQWVSPVQGPIEGETSQAMDLKVP